MIPFFFEKRGKRFADGRQDLGRYFIVVAIAKMFHQVVDLQSFVEFVIGLSYSWPIVTKCYCFRRNFACSDGEDDDKKTLFLQLLVSSACCGRRILFTFVSE